MRGISIALLFIIVTLLIVSTFSFAQTKEELKEKVDYTLPYPGILPDSPLYGLKALRDRLIEFFIQDPLKEAEFDLLASDKRLNAALYLFAKGKEKQALAESTLSKGANYFEKALNNLKLAKREGREADPILLINLKLSSKKHQEVIQELMEKTSPDRKKKLNKTFERFVSFEKQVIEFKLK